MVSKEWSANTTLPAGPHYTTQITETFGAVTTECEREGRPQQEQGAFMEYKLWNTNHRFQNWKGLRTNEVRANRNSLHC